MENRIVLIVQRNELTEYLIYNKLSKSIRNSDNAKILAKIAEDELKHYHILRNHSGVNVKPIKLKVLLYMFMAKIFGLTFTLKLMEKSEGNAIRVYSMLTKSLPGIHNVLMDEESHEKQLIDLLDEEKLKYVSSMVLGLNDALIELTGALAGFTIALQDSKLIGLIGLITGVAAALSMAASEYLSTKAEGGGKNPIKAATYTGLMYIVTVLLLILPYILFSNAYLCLGLTITCAVTIIFIFTFYVSIAKDLSFKKRFLEMLVISLGVAILSFILGFIVKLTFNVEV
ncbi:MAG: VIT1/CCC1 transporter family protein [Candidatus Methanomethylicia archaeon]